jgi:hypothetical protein
MRGAEVISRRFRMDNFRVDRSASIVGIVFLGALAVSILLFLLVGNSRVKRVFFFPASTDGRIAAESRLVPNHGDIELDIREFVEGEILGPVDYDFKLLMPREVTVRTLFVRSRVLYVDLSADFAVLGQGLPLGKAEMLDELKAAISFNFPRIREIVFLVDGQTPVFARTDKIR